MRASPWLAKERWVGGRTSLERILSSARQRVWQKVESLPDRSSEVTNTVQLAFGPLEYRMEWEKSRFSPKFLQSGRRKVAVRSTLARERQESVSKIEGQVQMCEAYRLVHGTARN
jgi:hypothetical protein